MNTECWVWTGRVNAQGYGVGGHSKRLIAHRFSYELANGLIPEGCEVHHLCGNRICVRPSHLALIERIAHRRESFIERMKTKKHQLPFNLDSWLRQRLDFIEE